MLHANDSERTTLTALNAISNESLLKCIAERLPHFDLVPKGEEKDTPTLLSMLKKRLTFCPSVLTREEKTWLFEEAGYEIVAKDEKPTLLSILKDRAADYPWNFTSEEKTWLFSSMESTDLINAIFARGLTLSLMEEFIKRSVKLGTDQRLAATQEENNNG